MNIEVVKSKIHRATVTQADLNYIGSITIDEDLLDAANIIENERVDIYNITNANVSALTLSKVNAVLASSESTAQQLIK